LPSNDGGPDYPRTEYADTIFSRDVDFDPMTMINELDIDILQMYLPTKMNSL